MKREMRLLFILALVIAARANAQITITSADLERFVGAHTVSTVHLMDTNDHAALAGLIAAVGANQRYDFTPYRYPSRLPSDFDIAGSAAATPGAGDPRLAGANYVRIATIPGAYGGTSHAYFILMSDGFSQLASDFIQGTDYDRNGILDTMWQHLDPSDRTPLPLEMGASWSQTFIGTSTGLGQTSTFTIAETATVEGWGDLLTPAGTQPALRVRRVRTTTTSGIEPITHTFFDFMTRTSLSGSVVLDENGAVVNASYADGTTTSSATSDRRALLELEQNVPNPVASSTSITFTLEQRGHTTLRIFDMLGQPILTLVNGVLGAGRHTIMVDAGELVDGAYHYRLETAGSTIARRLVVGR